MPIEDVYFAFLVVGKDFVREVFHGALHFHDDWCAYNLLLFVTIHEMMVPQGLIVKQADEYAIIIDKGTDYERIRESRDRHGIVI